MMMSSGRSAAASRPAKAGTKRVRVEHDDYVLHDTTMQQDDELDDITGLLKKIGYWAVSPIYTRLIVPSRLRPGPIDPHDNPKDHIVLRRYVLGKEGDLTTAIPRENVLDFFYPHSLEVEGRRKVERDLSKLKMRRDLFLLAFANVQSLPSSDKWSFYQIAGIHGLPHVPYDGAKGDWDPASYSDWWGGYCQHGSPLFPTWHRPYMMLVEQSIIRQAKLVAESLSDNTEKEEAAKLAEQLRFPYWDWANHTSRILGLPDVFTTTDIPLTYPWKSMARRSIPNPLKSFVLPENVGTPMASSDVYNPPAKPHYQVPSDGTPFIPLSYPTVRHVSPAYATQNDKLNLTLLRNAETVLVQGAHAIFHHHDWLSFSNHYWSGKGEKSPKQYGHYSSLELVHDMVHDTVGGSGGQMSYPETAGFDPIFFFHHANVDRLLALWQYCYPSVWIPNSDTNPEHDIDGTFTEKPDSAVDASTDLTPFRCSKDVFVCSNDVRTVDLDCGYSYPEIIRARKEHWAPARMLFYMLHLYKPPQHFIHRWFLVLERIRKGAFSGPYSIRVFLDLPNANASTPITSPHYAGSVFVFARNEAGINAGAGVILRCANCEVRPFMRASLELTATMLRLGITTAPEMSGDDGSIQPPQHNPLGGEGALKLVYVNQKREPLPDPAPGPKQTIVYQAEVPDEETYEFLFTAANASTSGAQPISDVLRQNHELPKNPAHYFPLTT